MPSRLSRLAAALLILGPHILFALFFASSIYLQGDAAFNGKAVDGRYFVGNHGVYTEVSQRAFLISLWLGRAMLASYLLLAVVALLGLVLNLLERAWRALRFGR